MVAFRPGRVRDLILRGAGLVLLVCCWLLIAWLLRETRVRSHEAGGLLACCAAAVAYFCFSVGGTLTAIGEHIFDKVRISQRWMRQSAPPAHNTRTDSPFFHGFSGD